MQGGSSLQAVAPARPCQLGSQAFRSMSLKPGLQCSFLIFFPVFLGGGLVSPMAPWFSSALTPTRLRSQFPCPASRGTWASLVSSSRAPGSLPLGKTGPCLLPRPCLHVSPVSLFLYGEWEGNWLHTLFVRASLSHPVETGGLWVPLATLVLNSLFSRVIP